MGDRSPWHHLYNTTAWRRLKTATHVKDNYTCRQCGQICGGKFPAKDSPVADHIKAHRGDPVRFYDPDNIQTLCKSPCHDSLKQAEEQESLHTRGCWD